MSSAEVSALLRQLGQQLEQGQLAVRGQPVPLARLRDLRLDLKPRGEQLRVKLELTLTPAAAEEQPGSAAPHAGSARGGYRALKRALERDWRQLRAALRAGQLPDAAVARGFLDASARMVTYPDRGAPLYDAFSRAVATLRLALDDGDIAAARAAADELARLKREGHRRFR